MTSHMTEVNKILENIELPRIVRVRQRFDNLELADAGGEVARKLNGRDLDIRPGQRIAITCGSRGIDKYLVMLKAIVDFVKSKGAHPVLIPAMGSHGGATAKGQTEVLEHFGITEEAMGAPILSSMEVAELGISGRGVPVYIDRNAYECDGIILFNRVKCHTSFRGKAESGLVKMTAIGLAKQKGAEMTHIFGFEHMGENILSVAEVTLSRLNIVAGVASVEDAFCHVAEVHVLKREEILEEEPKLLMRANQLMGRFYVDQCDALIMMKQGKEVSGSGLDCNVIGRNTVPHMFKKAEKPDIKAIGVLDLSEESAGNANGMGQSDFITRRFYNKIKLELGYMNALTSLAIMSPKMPMVMDTDRLLMQACVKFCGKPDRRKASLIIGVSTHDLEDLYMSQGALDLVLEEFRDRVETAGEFMDIPFDEKGNLLLFNDRSN